MQNLLRQGLVFNVSHYVLAHPNESCRALSTIEFLPPTAYDNIPCPVY
jgi:hypothetical protein